MSPKNPEFSSNPEIENIKNRFQIVREKMRDLEKEKMEIKRRLLDVTGRNYAAFLIDRLGPWKGQQGVCNVGVDENKDTAFLKDNDEVNVVLYAGGDERYDLTVPAGKLRGKGISLHATESDAHEALKAMERQAKEKK